MAIYLQKLGAKTYGSYVIDRIILQKRIKLSTYTKNRSIAVSMNNMITELMDSHDEGLTLLVTKQTNLVDLHKWYKKGAPTYINSEMHKSLGESLYKWSRIYSEWSDNTRKTNIKLIRSFLNNTDKTNSYLVVDLPKALRAYRAISEEKSIAAQFNSTRSVLRRFARVSFGGKSELHQLIRDIEPIKAKPKNKLYALSPSQIWRICQQLNEDKGAPFAEMVMTMCFSGIGWKEYGQSEAKADIKNPRILVRGTKNTFRNREIPYVFFSNRVGSESALLKAIQSAAKKQRITERVGVYSCRKCYSAWLANAGVPQYRIAQYMGHSAATMTERYQTAGALWQHFNEDAEKLSSYFNTEKVKHGPR